MTRPHDPHEWSHLMRTIEASIAIDAPLEAVWRTLSAGSAYSDWTPFITEVTGDLEVGQRPTLRIAPPGKKSMTFRPRITAASPTDGLRWTGRLVLPGLCDGTHEFVLRAETSTRTRLTQRESFRGVLVPLLGSMLEPTRNGFVAMNDALRRRVESEIATSPPRPPRFVTEQPGKHWALPA